MDRYLFESFVFGMEDETMSQSLVVFAHQAKSMVEKEGNSKVTFNYYPQEEDKLQLVVEAERKNGEVAVNYLKVHHTSPDIWKLKIIDPLSLHKDCYMASREDGSGCIIIRLVNEQVLGDIKSGDIIKAQVVGMAMAIDIFEDEEAYKENVPEGKDGQKYLMGDGDIIPANMIINNNTNLTEEERKEIDHSFDNLVDFKGTIKQVWKYPLRIFDMDVNNYYMAEVDTEYGNLHIVIPFPMFPEELKGFGAGNIIAGKLLISGDVCIDEYEKYAKGITINKNSKAQGK